MKRLLFAVILSFSAQIGFAQNSAEIDSLRNIIKQSMIKDSNYVKAAISLANALVFSVPDSSHLLADEALQVAEKIQWPLGIALSLRQKGLVFYYMSDYLQAIEYCQKALKAGESLKNELFDASVYSNLANVYADMKDYEKALSYYNRLLKVTQETKNRKYELIAFTNIGNIYSELNNYAQGLEYFQKGLFVARQINDLNSVALILGNIGITLKNRGDYQTALFYLQQGIAVSDSTGNKFSKATILSGIADLYIQLKEYNKAKMFAMQSLQLGKEIGNVTWQSDAYKILSTVYEKQGKNAEALNAYKNYIILRDSVLNDKKSREIAKKEIQFESDKKQALAAAEIQKQRIVKNSIIAGAGFLIIAGIGGFIFYKRNRDIKTKKDEAEFKSQISDTEMKALRAQMNPHFIFNSLNSIADYIDKNQTQIASDFTVKFAKLMRLVLENSEHKAIPLADDLKALELYMQLERFRLQNKFDYTINVDENIDKENTLVPPLILQPFVENSIWHGIAKKEGSGNIIIYIKQEGEMINCIVQDDGIGISESKIIDKENKSLGMRITKERIDIINRIKNSHASINIFNIEKGVRAEVKLPLELSF